MINAIQVNLKTYQRQWRINRNLIKTFLNRTWKEILRVVRPKPPVFTEVSVIFLNDNQMQSYNKRYRSRDYPTDVLSFPVNETVEDRHYLGDILISMATTARQAQEKAHSLENELKILLLHGMLHLLGYDHEADSGEMDRLEKRLRRKLIGGL